MAPKVVALPQHMPEPAYPGIGIYSEKVQTVLGPISVDEMGITLMHEHVFVDVSSLWQEPADTARKSLAHQPVEMGILGELRLDPMVNLDNTKLQSFDDAIEELMLFKELGGVSLVDVTNNDIGRDPHALQKVSQQTGLNIICGVGHYLETAHPGRLGSMNVDEIEAEILHDIVDGIRGESVSPGIIGEIGVSAAFSEQEQKVLKAAAQASGKVQLPLSIHLPGWERRGHQILDRVAESGGNLEHTILDHMNPSLRNLDYQMSLADRGAFLEYDMIGMDYFYAGLEGQSPCDEENAIAIQELISAGYICSLLLSQDVFLKMMLTRYGGFGYGYILKHFVPRLMRHGVTPEQIKAMLVDNPRRVFSARHRSFTAMQ